MSASAIDPRDSEPVSTADQPVPAPEFGLSDLPSVDRLLRTPEASRLRTIVSAEFLADCARSLIADWRYAVQHQAMTDALRVAIRQPGLALESWVQRSLRRSLRRVINATGVVIHTNLGRAPWPQRAIDQASAVASTYSNLEYDLGTGLRGNREGHLAHAARVFGGEATLVVNNNAAAVLLAVNTLAAGRETIVSRGELVEIGGSFRIPDILTRAGSRMREVGTTNRTRLADYRSAVTADTAVLFKAHPSNYRILGFTEAVAIADLAALARATGLLVVEDLGSGAAVDLSRLGIDDPTVASSVAAGVDLVLFSGDKLLGGPQAGFLVGRRSVVAACRENPLYRALRPDKVTIAAIDEILRIYATGDPWSEIPVLRDLAASAALLEERAVALADRLRQFGFQVEVVTGSAAVGGGAAPLCPLPSKLVRVRHPQTSASAIERAIRTGDPAVVARMEDGAVVVDLRTVRGDEEPLLVNALVNAIDPRTS